MVSLSNALVDNDYFGPNWLIVGLSRLSAIIPEQFKDSVLKKSQKPSLTLFLPVKKFFQFARRILRFKETSFIIRVLRKNAFFLLWEALQEQFDDERTD